MPQKYKDQDSDNKSQEYRLVVLRADNLEEVRSVNLSLSNIYVITSLVVIALSILLILMLVLTPLKRLVPGYGDIESTPEFIELVKGVDELGHKMEAQELYLNALRKMITSNGDTSNVDELSYIVKEHNNLANEADEISHVKDKSRSTNLVAPPSDARESEVLWRAIEADRPLAPLEGLISSEFDPVKKHFGVDVLAPSNTAVRAILDGYVISSGWDLETGYTIGVQHKGEIISFYKHNSILLKEKGTFVSAGEAIAIIGNTGTLSSGPHLHFEFWHHGKPINPKDIINFN